jgi:UDP-N-acetylglucosamine:LPS N-acetylglucosamine transferase
VFVDLQKKSEQEEEEKGKEGKQTFVVVGGGLGNAATSEASCCNWTNRAERLSLFGLVAAATARQFASLGSAVRAGAGEPSGKPSLGNFP